MTTGKLSVHTENILPLIKKWLYSEKEIFLREVVSNAFDAITKLKKIALNEEIHEPGETDYFINLKIDRENNILSIEDNGVGLTQEEIVKYITQIAFSGAEDFIKKYEESGDKSKTGIIGNFGLGFFSTFMVSEKVEIHSRSYRPEAESAFWSSTGSEEYEIGPGNREKRGTEIKLYLDTDSRDLLDKGRLSELIRKYCDFMPVTIQVDGTQVNKKEALWARQPSSLKKEDYHEFYRQLYPFQGDPLFYVHLNVDYPFRLQGILFFPHLEHELDLNRSNVRIYCKQVFVTDEAQELIPRWLTVLQGVIDMPDLPLNVSRSYLQNEPQVKKIAQHIIKKVADSLVLECKNEPEHYRKIWPDIGPFVKYGMLNDEKFYEQAESALIFELADPTEKEKKFCSLDEYIVENKAKTGDKVYYTTDPAAQTTALKLFHDQGIGVVVLSALIDSHFLNFLEGKKSDCKFTRIDAEIADHVIDKSAGSGLVGADNKDQKERLETLFKKALGNEKITIRVEALKSDSVPAMILVNEHIRRFSEMSQLMGRGEKMPFPAEHTLIINTRNPFIQKLAAPDIIAEGTTGKKELLAREVYALSRLAQNGYTPAELTDFIASTYTLLERLHS